MKKIEIHCAYEDLIPLDELFSIQGNLKKDHSLANLRRSIINNGICFPASVWRDPKDGRIKIIDGAHRIQLCRGLIDDGYVLDQNSYPVIYEPCADMEEAKEMVVRANSMAAKPSKKSTGEYVQNNGLDIDELSNELSADPFGWLEDLNKSTPDIKTKSPDVTVKRSMSRKEDFEYKMFRIVFRDKEQASKFWRIMSRIRAVAYRKLDYRDVLLDILKKRSEIEARNG